METDNKINGRTPEEIKWGLECCNAFNACPSCPYEHIVDTEHGWGCVVIRNADALAYIQQLEDLFRDLTKKVEQLERERDEARNDLDTISYANTELHGAYEAMKRERDAAVEAVGKLADNCDRSIACEYCEFRDYQCIDCEFKWRGVQEVE